MKVEIVKLDDFGRGICFVNNKVTFVPNTIPGDIVNIKIVKENKKYNEAILIDLVKSSSKRVDAPCPYFGICGGCSLQTLPYDLGISYKKDKVINYFKKMGLIIVPNVIPNDIPYNYRNKITLKVVNGVVGYYKLNSHSVVEIKKCILAEECINDAISIVCGMGIINGEVIIRSNSKKEILIIINSKDKINIPNINENIKGIIINDEVIYGNDYFYEEINNIKYKVSYKAFFQVNRNVASKMFKLVEDFTNNDDCVLDLYSGVGTLGLSASQKTKNVLGVEINKDAVKDANENAVINKLNNAKFIYSDASNIKNIDVSFNKLIVDPPRAGLSREVIDFIKFKLPDEIMYISCDYHTQARDLKLLDSYEIIDSYICDLFSYTYHVECICFLRKRRWFNLKKIFLCLYPVREFCYDYDCLLDEDEFDHCYKVLNECIEKRYRENGYQVVFAMYPEKNIFGVIPDATDKIITTDVSFEEATKKDEDKVKYPSEEYLIKQLGDFDTIVIGGFHFADCVKRVAEYCYNQGYQTLVDLDLTDLFYSVHRIREYFDIYEYDPREYKEFMIQSMSRNLPKEIVKKIFLNSYASPVYGMFDEEKLASKKNI